MTYSNDPKWRKFMDAKWKEMEQNRMKPSTSDMLIHSSSSTNIMLETMKKKEEKPISPVHAKPKAKKVPVPVVKRPMQQAARPRAHGAAPRITKPTIAEMGQRRRAIGAKQNPSTDELKEYHSLSNKIEKELSDRQVELNEDWKKS